jgi:zeaxanthin glucosyltransferase
MATIAFCIFNYQGELNSTLKLAKKLKLLGHQIWYLGLPDSEDKVYINGFTFLPILKKWFPKGFAKEVEFNSSDSNKIKLLFKQVKHQKSLDSLINSLVKGENREIHTTLKTINPDLLIISTDHEFYSTFLALIAYECKIKTIYLTGVFTSLPQQDFIPKENNIYNNLKVKNKYDYRYLLKIIQKIIVLLNIKFSSSENPVVTFANKIKLPLELLNLSQPIPLKLPHIFLCPKELDFPNSLREKCYYAEASIDLLREEPSFSWSKLDKEKSLIYCSLGTTAGTFATLNKKEIRRFFQAVIDAISIKDEYQLVLSVSDYINVEDFHDLPSNTIVVNKAPQLALIQNASIAIIAGGIHTIKECIFFGVPMIVFPVWADQPGNAARIKYHELGVVADIKNTSVNLIIDLVETIENDFLLQQRVKAWGEKFKEIENSGKATQLILEMLEQGQHITFSI